MKHNTPKTSSIEKAMDILTAFTREDLELSTKELSERLPYNIATVHRTLHILTKKEMLQQDKHTKKFKLGNLAFNLGRNAFRTTSGKLFDIAIPYIVNLSEQIGETVMLSAVSDRRILVIYIEQGRSGNSIQPSIGESISRHASAGGKAILAFMPPYEWQTFLDHELEAFTPNTITNLEVLKRQLAQIRQDGIAFCEEERILGLNAIAAPLINHNNRPVGAVTVLGLVGRLKCDNRSPMVAELKKTAAEINARLFASGLKPYS